MHNQLSIASSPQAYTHLRPLFKPHQEELWILALSSSLLLIDQACIFRGSVDSCQSHPREIFAYLLEQRASQFIMAHNHPRGPAEPSSQDLKFTAQIAKAGQLMMIPLVDHIILGQHGYISLQEKGFIRKPRRPNTKA